MEERVKAREKRMKSENSVIVLIDPELTVQCIYIYYNSHMRAQLLKLTNSAIYRSILNYLSNQI